MKKHAHANDDTFIDSVAEYSRTDKADNLHRCHQGDHEPRDDQRIAELSVNMQHQMYHYCPDDQQRGAVAKRYEPEGFCLHGLTGGEVGFAKPCRSAAFLTVC